MLLVVKILIFLLLLLLWKACRFVYLTKKHKKKPKAACINSFFDLFSKFYFDFYYNFYHEKHTKIVERGDKFSTGEIGTITLLVKEDQRKKTFCSMLLINSGSLSALQLEAV